MTTSNTITKTDLTNILNEVLPVVQHTARVGEISMFAGSTAPTGWLICNGSAVSRTTYSALFAVIGTTYGSGDGSATFNLPDFRNNFPVGAGNTYSLNSKGGYKDSIVVSHTHRLSSGWSSAAGTDRITFGQVNGAYQNAGTGNVQFVESTGSTGTNRNLPPYIGINFIIYAGTDYPSVNSNIDFIIEQGTSGSWTYRKWNSGIAECWLSAYNVGSKAMTTQEGSGYYAPLATYSFPTGFFIATPSVAVTADLQGALGGFSMSYSNKDSVAGYWWATRSVTKTCYLNIYAKGTWK